MPTEQGPKFGRSLSCVCSKLEPGSHTCTGKDNSGEFTQSREIRIKIAVVSSKLIMRDCGKRGLDGLEGKKRSFFLPQFKSSKVSLNEAAGSLGKEKMLLMFTNVLLNSIELNATFFLKNKYFLIST